MVLVELSPRLNPGPTDERIATHAALDWLWSLGYTDVAHSGEICEERWRNVTRHADTRGGGGGADHALKQPTWCHASRADLPALAYGAGTEPESVLLPSENEWFGHSSPTGVTSPVAPSIAITDTFDCGVGK